MCVQSRSTSRRICDLIMFFRIFEHLYLRREMRRNYERNFTHIHFELRVTFWTSIYGLSYGNPISVTKHSQAPCCPAPIPCYIPTTSYLRHISALYDAFGRFSPVLPYFALHYFGLDKTGPNICNGDDVKMVTSNLSAHINDVLRYVGITRNMNAYIILSQALTLIAEDEDRLRAVEKELYTPIADKKMYEPKAVQSTILRADAY